MRGRLAVAIVTTILEEAALVVAYLWGLPVLGIDWPIWPLPFLMLGWLLFAVFSFNKGTEALKRKTMPGLPSVIGCSGKVIRALAPNGLVSIGGELWTARAEGGEIGKGEKVIVVKQDRTKITVSLHHS
jgi:membrane-bound ClpP family serine protease